MKKFNLIKGWLAVLVSFAVIPAQAQNRKPDPHVNPASPQLTAADLNAYKGNGRLFGASFPNTHGLSVKAALAVPAADADSKSFFTIAQGTICHLDALALATENVLKLDSHYGLYKKELTETELTLSFRNVFRLPSELKIICSGESEHLKHLTVAEIEADLAQSFYIYLNL